MKKKLTMMMMSFAFALLALPMVGHASEADATPIATYDELVQAAATGGEYKLTEDITMVGKGPIEATADLTLWGAEHTIDGTGMVKSATSNASILTVHEGKTLNLYSMTIKNAMKYGVQAFNGGKAYVHGVRIENCTYGAILVNGGNLVVGDLTMKDNGEHEGGNGIELGKNSTNYDPVLSVKGILTVEAGTQTSAFYLAENDNLTKVTIVNEEERVNTLAIQDGKIVLLNPDGSSKYESNKPAKEVELVDDTKEEPTPTPTPTPTPGDGENETQPDQVASENPNTYDGILGYVALAMVGACTLAFGAKKAFSK